MSHVVILGAGASRAAFPNGDSASRQLPVMTDLIDVLDLGLLLAEYEVKGEREDFESIFADLYEKNPGSPLLHAIELRVQEYFSSLKLPETATIYDRLILSLQPRDIIATFNWDPLLFLAYQRNRVLRRLPQIVALHGSVAVGACEKHLSVGFAWGTCHECGQRYQPVRLLYPIRTKDYQTDAFIAGQWQILRAYMKRGYWLTIFGYGAPETDVEAVALLKEMARENSSRDIGNVEIIDIKSREELVARWEPFFVRNHYSILSTFEQSVLSRHPRRSAEVLWLQSQLLSPQSPTPFPETTDLDELQHAAAELFPEEELQEKQREHENVL